MGDVWIRDAPFDPVTDSLKIAEHFIISHKHILRAIDKCFDELSTEPKSGPIQNFMENKYLGGAAGKKRQARKIDITEFGLTLLLLYINIPKARLFSAEILYRFFILKTYIDGLSENERLETLIYKVTSMPHHIKSLVLNGAFLLNMLKTPSSVKTP